MDYTVYMLNGRYLELPAPAAFAEIKVDEAPLLTDIMLSGLHGADIDRLHSANITLRTVAAARTGEARIGGLRASLFPPRRNLTGEYPFLEKQPWLLPVVWTKRIIVYLTHRRKNGNVIHPTASLRIGRERVALLEQYNIIDSGS